MARWLKVFTFIIFLFFLVVLLFYVRDYGGRYLFICVRRDDVVMMKLQVADGENFTLTFVHSMYGGQVYVTYKITRNGFMPLEIASNDGASISYYTDDYTYNGTMFVSKLKGVSLNKIIIDDGWSIIINGQKYKLTGGNVYELSLVSDFYEC